jgi:O-antigen/teichoic acid export membrane protein
VDRKKALATIAKGGGMTAVGMVLSKFLTYLYRAVVARFLDPAAYGQLSLGISVLAVLVSLSLLGMGPAVSKYVSEHLEKGDMASVKSYVKTALVTSLPASLAASALMFFGADFISSSLLNAENPGQVAAVIKVLAIVPPLGNTLDLMDSVIEAYKRIEYEVINEFIFRNLVQVAVTAALILGFGFGPVAGAWGWVVGTLLALIYALFIVERRLGPILTRDVAAELRSREVFRFSAPLVLGGAIGTLLGHVDTILIGRFLTEAEVGLYNAALPIAALVQLPHLALAKLVLPSVESLKEENEAELASMLKTVTRWTVSLCFPIFLLATAFPGHAINLLFGNQYAAAGTALAVLAAGRLVRASTGHVGSLIHSYEDTRFSAYNSTAKLLINIALNLALIPVLGIEGAAVATAVTNSSANLLKVAEVYWLHGIHPYGRHIYKPVAASVIAAVPVYIALQSIFEVTPAIALVPGLAAFGSLYGILLVAMGGVTEDDRPIIVGVGRRLGVEDRADDLADLLVR